MTPRGKTLGIAPGNDALGELLKVFDGSWVSGWPRMTTIYHFFHHFGYHFSGREKTPKKAWTWLKFRPTFWGSEFWIYDVYTSYQTGYVYIYIYICHCHHISILYIYTQLIQEIVVPATKHGSRLVTLGLRSCRHLSKAFFKEASGW